MKKFTINYVKDQIKKLHPGSISLFEEYKNRYTKLNLICENNHKFKIRFSDILQGQWCAKCYQAKQTYTIKYVKDFINKKHPNSICKSINYKNSHTKLTFICENNHSFKMRFNNIQQGQWCPECAGNKKHTIGYIKNFIETKHVGSKCLSIDYKNALTKLDLICENNHKFRMTFNGIQQNSWCPECQELKSEKYIRSIFEKLTNKTFEKIKPDWLINDKTNCKLELDGFNKDLNLAFECQGIQHYKLHKKFHKNKDSFINQQYRDNLKIELCKKNGVKLILVPAIGININGKIYKKEDIENMIKEFLIK